MKTKSKNKQLYFIPLLALFLFIFAVTTAYADFLVGKWGYSILRHDNDGSWYVEGGTIIFNNDGTGMKTYGYNDNGILASGGGEEFTYTITSDGDGSYTLQTIKKDGDTKARKVVFSDNGKMIIDAGGKNTDNQHLYIAVKMDESKTYSNADLAGDFYVIGYDYDSVGSNWPGHYVADSAIATADGIGNVSQKHTLNGDGTIRNGSWVDSYAVNPDGSLNDNGLMSGDGKLLVFSSAKKTYYWEIGFGMKKDEKAYSSADLAGTWAISGFGDDNGNSFNAEFGTMTCDISGNCIYSFKNQRDGDIKFESGSKTLSVAVDGSFGKSLGSKVPYYAAAIGNNGDTVVVNPSFQGSDPGHREIFIGVRCSNCLNLINPPSGSVIINNNDKYTNLSSVALTLSANGDKPPFYMCISNTSGSCTTWEKYSASKKWNLSSGDGIKTVYVWFKDSLGKVNTKPSADSIILLRDGVYSSDVQDIILAIYNLIDIINQKGKNITADDIEQFFASDPGFGISDGLNRSQTIDSFGPPSLIDLGYKIVSIDIKQKGRDGEKYIIGFKVHFSDGTVNGPSNDWYFVKENGSWKLTGNGFKSEPRMNAESDKWINADGSIRIESGINCYIDDNGQWGLQKAVITGPGLPAGGITLSKPQDEPDRLLLDELYRSDIPTHNQYLYVMNDKIIKKIPNKAVYTVNVYDINNVLIETREITIPKRPFKRSELKKRKPSYFPKLNGITSHELSAADIGGTLTFSFTKPAAYKVYTISAALNFWDYSGNSEWDEKELPLTVNYAGIESGNPAAWTPLEGRLSIETTDNFNRSVRLQWMFKDY